jgi:hypothetical protein
MMRKKWFRQQEVTLQSSVGSTKLQRRNTIITEAKEGNKRSGENSPRGRERILQLLSMHKKAGHLNLNK